MILKQIYFHLILSTLLIMENKTPQNAGRSIYIARVAEVTGDVSVYGISKGMSSLSGNALCNLAGMVVPWNSTDTVSSKHLKIFCLWL